MNDTEYIALGGGLYKDFETKSNAFWIIKTKEKSITTSYNLLVADYFYDNQVLDLEKELMVVGYVHTWKLIKSNGKFTKHQTHGLKNKLGATRLVMP